MMKKTYFAPSMDCVFLPSDDIIVTSLQKSDELGNFMIVDWE